MKTTKYNKRTVTCDIRAAQCKDETIKYEEKKKGTTKCDKNTVQYDVETVQCEDGTVKCEKKVRKPPNVTKELSYVMLESHNMRMEP